MNDTAIETLVRSHNILFPSAPNSWHLGMPVANGEIGAMVWGNGNPLVLTLDRYDCWETRSWRPDPKVYNYRYWREQIERGDFSFKRYMEDDHWARRSTGEDPSPTRLPLGRLELRLPAPLESASGRVDLHDGDARLGGSVASKPLTITVLAHAQQNVILVDLQGAAAKQVNWQLVPARLSEGEWKRLERLGYQPAVVADDGPWRELTWGFDSDKELSVSGRQYTSGDRCLLAVSINIGPRGQNVARELARAAVSRSLPRGLASLDARVREHRQWWRSFWRASQIELPDKEIEAIFYRELYKLASVSREGKFPCSLQGLWTQDGGLPPWAGDYHLDMNVQETYWPVYASNHLELGLPLYEQFCSNLPRYQTMCREFFGFDGAYSRCEQGLHGEPIFGYYTTNMWPGNGAWLAHHYWLHWLYSRDRRFLRDRAYPMMREFMRTYLNLLERGPDGYLHLPVTNSPEFHENGNAAWGRDDTGGLCLIRFLCEALLETVLVLKTRDNDEHRWRSTLQRLAPLPGTSRKPDGSLSYAGTDGLQVMAGRPYDHPHRHMTHLMGLYPLCNLRLGRSDEEDRLLRDSMDNMLARAKPISQWTGWTFPWVSLLASHAGMADVAVEMLHTYLKAHTYPNTLHENGDYKKLGTTVIRYGGPCITLEAGFASCAAVADLLLQSDGGRLRLFPATPESWREASFHHLRAEGAFLVSAERRNARTVRAEITSLAGETCCLDISSFGSGTTPAVQRARDGKSAPAKLQGIAITFPTRRGEAYIVLPAEL